MHLSVALATRILVEPAFARVLFKYDASFVGVSSRAVNVESRISYCLFLWAILLNYDIAITCRALFGVFIFLVLLLTHLERNTSRWASGKSRVSFLDQAYGDYQWGKLLIGASTFEIVIANIIIE